MKDEIKEMCHKCKKYPAEYNQTYCEFCLGISNKDDYITNLQEENKRLNNIINQLEKELKDDYKIWMCNSRSNGKSVKFGIDVCKMHFYNRLQELKGSDE